MPRSRSDRRPRPHRRRQTAWGSASSTRLRPRHSISSPGANAPTSVAVSQSKATSICPRRTARTKDKPVNTHGAVAGRLVTEMTGVGFSSKYTLITRSRVIVPFIVNRITWNWSSPIDGGSSGLASIP